VRSVDLPRVFFNKAIPASEAARILAFLMKAVILHLRIRFQSIFTDFKKYRGIYFAGRRR
jgi:hypothetical protein